MNFVNFLDKGIDSPFYPGRLQYAIRYSLPVARREDMRLLLNELNDFLVCFALKFLWFNNKVCQPEPECVWYLSQKSLPSEGLLRLWTCKCAAVLRPRLATGMKSQLWFSVAASGQGEPPKMGPALARAHRHRPPRQPGPAGKFTRATCWFLGSCLSF